MSKKIPFLELFAALTRWTELSNAVEGWLIVTANIDRATLSAKIHVEGASGAGPNLLAEAEDKICRAYGLRSVRIVPEEAVPVQPVPVEKAQEAPAPVAEAKPEPAPAPVAEEKPKAAPVAAEKTAQPPRQSVPAQQEQKKEAPKAK